MSATAPKVLLIEDEKQIRRFVRAALEDEGCQVIEAETMAQGLIEAGSIDGEQSRLKSGRLWFLGRHEESPDG